MIERVTFGKTNWDRPMQSGGGITDDFLQLNKDGAYEIRVIGDAPFEFAIHWVDDDKGNSKRFKCAGRGCVLCKDGHKPQVRYLLEIMNRKDGENNKCQIVEFGPQVYNQIVALNNNKYWGDPKNYDILIDRSKARGPSDMYQVMAIGNKGPLPQELTSRAEEFKRRVESVIAKIAEPAKNEEILKKLQGDGDTTSASGGGNGGGRSPVATVTASAAPVKKPPAVDADDENFDF